MDDVLHARLNGTKWTNKSMLFIYNLLSKQMEQLEGKKKLSISCFDSPYSRQNPAVWQGSCLHDYDLNFQTAEPLCFTGDPELWLTSLQLFAVIWVQMMKLES